MTILDNAVSLSIVVPAYQAEQTIQRAVGSILELKEIAFEVIVVDDGSSDGTPAILASLAMNDSRVKVVTQENRGRSAARNKGVEVASGRWVMFVDADDYLLASGFPALVNRCEMSDASLVVFGMKANGEQQRKAFSAGGYNKITSVAASAFIKAMINDYTFTIVDDAELYETNAVWARLYKRDSLLHLAEMTNGVMTPFPEGLRFSEDRLLNVAYLKSLGSESVEFVPIELYFWDFEESQTCGVLHEGDSTSLDVFCDSVKIMVAAEFVDEEEARCLVAREAIGQFQRLVKLAYSANSTLLDEYMLLFSRSDIVRAIAGSPSGAYCSTLFWQAMGYLIGKGRSWLAFRLSALAFRAKGIVARGRQLGR